MVVGAESRYTATKGMNTGRNEDFDVATEPLRSGTEVTILFNRYV